MTANNYTTGSETSPFLQSHSVQLRIWHWLTFLFLSASMLTVLMNSTLLSPRENIKLVQAQLERKGLIATEEQAFAVSHEYQEKMWEVHKLVGLGLALLVFSRLMIELMQPEEEKLRNRLKMAAVLYKQNDGNKAEYRYYLIVKRTYLLFYLLLFLMALTGLGLVFGQDVEFLRQIRKPLKNIHGLIQYLMYAFVFFHLCGVIIADLGKAKGIVSGMINGNRR
jgi:cytochrome b561